MVLDKTVILSLVDRHNIPKG